ncbi:TetR/AcrR family transcriptional regulator [Brevibacillus brevis]|uniref:TetR/AcrR family transcriptional regulator n=1 Tax=Brevibacillus brevis TaxID=1393 RepID=A0ABY9T250_BREBE|nr:TetR/AcrR family transcriptional regulator [Brevibacillus brevis]WNC14161.1 TetR/AcrR family transcriptional regulator [Brevibacillus brevis]
MRKPVSVETYIERIKPVLRKVRFSQLKIDDIARYMDISKVTLYKHFATRDDIISEVVNHYIDYLTEADSAVRDETIPFAERFRMTYVQSLKCVAYVSDLFLLDLKESYPNLLEKLMAAQHARHKQLEVFFTAGMENGIFNPMNGTLFAVQDDAVLRRIMEPSFCIQYDLTLKQALLDFYQLKKYQLLKPEYQDSTDDLAMEREIVQILQSIS